MNRDTYKTHINTQSITKLFFDMAEERYPSSEKLAQLVSRIVDPMGGDRWETVNLKIAVLTMMRDMVKQVSPSRLYRTMQHRDDLFLAVIEALEDLEDQLEEIEEESLEEQENETNKS